MSTDQERIAAARHAYTDLSARAHAREPWSLATTFGTQPEASWGPREVLAHVGEMLPFWLGELERVVDGAAATAAVGATVPFGRVADDAVRIGVIERDRSLPLRLLFGRVDAGLRDWAERLTTLTDADRARIGVHPRLGEMPAPAILERFVLDHAEEHIAQLETILSARPD